MIAITKDFTAYMFSSALDTLEIATNEDNITFVVSNADGDILNEKYVPDNNGVIVIADLKDLIEPYLRNKLIDTFNYQVIGTTTINKSFVVQFCAAESPLDALPFLEGYFLSSLLGPKTTSIGRKEFLHLVATEATPISVECLYLVGGKTYRFETVNLNTITTLNEVSTLDVSPDLFDSSDDILFQYTVTAGSRTQIFNLDINNPDIAPALLFTNSFGCQETLYCTGTHTLSPSFERSQAMINGMFRNYQIEETRVFTANTGVLTFEMALWAEDLFRSKEIYLLVDDQPGKEISITESQSERNNDLDTLPSFTFKYRYAQRQQNIIQLARAGRVFDNTFDNTFG